MASIHPKHNSFEDVRFVPSLASPESVLFEGAKVFTQEEYYSWESLDLHEVERPSSPSIEHKPLPADPHYVILDDNRESIMIVHDESLEKKDHWAMAILEASTLESGRKDPLDEHGTFFLEKPQDPCSHNTSLESATTCATSMYEL